MITDKKMSPGTEPELAGSKLSRAPSKHDNKKSTHTLAGVVLQESVRISNVHKFRFIQKRDYTLL